MRRTHPERSIRSRAANVLLAVACALPASLATAGPAASSDAAGYELRLTRGSWLMIDARINGVSSRALLDSAAESTLVDQGFANRLNLAAGASAEGHGSGRDSFGARLVGAVKLEAVGLSLEDQTVAVVDLADVGNRLLKRHIEVILGREIFDAARLYIDIEGRRIAVSRDPAPRGVKLDLVTEHGVETVPVRVEDGPPVRATFDLGNGSQILLSRPYAMRMKLLTDGRKVGSASGGGIGGAVSRQTIVLRSLEIAGRRFEKVEAAIDAQQGASDVNVGISILRHFRLTTDFAAHAAWFDPR
jgi:predicted aspartyl protease